MSRYEPLQRFLSGCLQAETQMTFREVEGILNRNLPESARKHQAWWANTRSHSHAESWLEAGFRTERLDLGTERVVFVRSRQQSSKRFSEKSVVGDSLDIPLSTLTGAGLKLVDDYAGRHGIARPEAAAAILNMKGGEHRKALLGWFHSRWTGKLGSDSVDLVREDRDGR